MFGRPEYDPLLDAYECEICHEYFSALARHVKPAHGITIKEYKKKFGLDRNVSLISSTEAQKRRETAKKLGIFKEFNKKNPFQFKKGKNGVQKYQRSNQSMRFLISKLSPMGVKRKKEKTKIKKLTV
jgi:hypothetical protein